MSLMSFCWFTFIDFLNSSKATNFDRKRPQSSYCLDDLFLYHQNQQNSSKTMSHEFSQTLEPIKLVSVEKKLQTMLVKLVQIGLRVVKIQI